ncbi:MAG: PqiC family protein [Methylobacter sp.]|nr:PqiC family protein [Methylobacter sp.]
MLNKFSKQLIVLAITAVLLTACASTPATNFYVLEPLSEPTASTTKTANKRLIGIGPVSMPALLERKQIVTRGENSSVQIAEFHQWASPLKENIVQALAHNLAALRPDDTVRTYPWSAFGSVNYRIILDILRFDTSPGKSVNLEANWVIMDEKKQALLSSGHSEIEHPLKDTSYPGTINALSKILAEFSQELSAELGQVK